MSANIAKSTGILKFGRLAFTGIGCSIAICYGKVIIMSALVLLGIVETTKFNIHLQAVAMIAFAAIGLVGLALDRKVHHDSRPFAVALGAFIFLFVLIYTDLFSEADYRRLELVAYSVLIIAVFWNQNIALKSLASQLSQRNAEIEQKNTQLAQVSQMKSKFLAAMSHELRTPLNAIIGFSEVLEARMFGELNDKQAEYARDIHDAGRHLLALINDILDLSKVEAGRMELELAEFDLPQLLESAALLVRERAQAHGMSLEINVDESLDGIVGDERRLKQVLVNLLGNAVKFTPDGGRIELSAVPTGDTVKITVSDTGPGIALEDQKTIFEEFRQISDNTSQNQEGLGLGLALSKRFVDMHHGTIRVQSEPGRGSTFTVTLPLRQKLK